ncbi:MAG: class F sortase [Candidatus Campbellbacteria bacterium]|nr:class F sortase [Candidatus Campbellbacteria bacterium]
MMLFNSEMNTKKVLISVGVVLLVVGFGILIASQGGVTTYLTQKNSQETLATSSRPIFDPARPLEDSDPMRLRIPDIFVDTNFVPLGLQENGEIEIPKGYTEVGWYTYGPTPGEIGPAVVLGHVDSYEGPGVFLSLGQLTEGDYVYVDRADGTTATFRVTVLERYDRSNFPTEKVYGDITFPGLRLITCSGTYSQETQEYDRVLVVYATLVDSDDTK